MSELRVDNIVSQDGSTAPTYSKGIRISAGQTMTNEGDYTVSGSTTLSGPVNITSSLGLSDLNVSGVATFQSNVHLGDDDEIQFGDDNDAIIKVDTTQNFILQGDGTTYLRGSTVDIGANGGAGGFETGIRVSEVSAETSQVELFYDNSAKLTTTEYGISIDGGVNATGVITATDFYTGAEGSAIRVTSNTISGPAEMYIDPAAVGDDTGAIRIRGDLYVDGTQTVINSTTLDVADYNVGIATTVTTNIALDGAGFGIGDSSIRKTFNYNNTANTLESSIGLGVTAGGDFKTGSSSVLNQTTLGATVVNSSLTSVGTLANLNVSGISTLGTIYGDGSNITNPPPADGQEFNTGITSALSSTLTGLGVTVLTLPATAGKQYIVYSIHASNVAAGNTEVNVIGAFDYNGGERTYFGYNIDVYDMEE